VAIVNFSANTLEPDFVLVIWELSILYYLPYSPAYKDLKQIRYRPGLINKVFNLYYSFMNFNKYFNILAFIIKRIKC